MKEIERGSIKIGEKLGEGHFGEVLLGDWQGTPVALKVLFRGEDKAERQSFYQEAALVWSLDHPNIVRMLGTYKSSEGAEMMVFELADKGNLESLLKTQGSKLTFLEKLTMIQQIVSGLRYLQRNNIIHRDLAARNILVTEGKKIKISDLGMSRFSDYATKNASAVPTRWCSPEVVKNRQFSHASDIWSFGVVVWEIFSNGMKPYYQYSEYAVAQMIKNNHLLEKPLDCPDVIYEMMLSCWTTEPSKRTSFSQIYQRVEEIIKHNTVVLPHQNEILDVVDDHYQDPLFEYNE